MPDNVDIDRINERLPVVLLLDTSDSMSGASIDQLNAGLQEFWAEVTADESARHRIEIAVVTFGPVRLTQRFATIDHLPLPTLTAAGCAPIAGAVELCIDLIAQRKKDYKAHQTEYWKPHIILITKGAADHGTNWQDVASRVQTCEDERKFRFHTIGVEGADMQALAQIAPPPLKLAETRFADLLWGFGSSTGISKGTPSRITSLPEPGSWSRLDV